MFPQNKITSTIPRNSMSSKNMSNKAEVSFKENFADDLKDLDVVFGNSSFVASTPNPQLKRKAEPVKNSNGLAKFFADNKLKQEPPNKLLKVNNSLDAHKHENNLTAGSSNHIKTENMTKSKEAENNETKNSPAVITGCVETILSFLKKSKDNANIIYEIYANVLSIKAGKFEIERCVILRNGATGPVLSAVYYEDNEANSALGFPTNSLVRCVGSFINGTRRFRIDKILQLSPNDLVLMQRLEALSHFAFNKNLAK